MKRIFTGITIGVAALAALLYVIFSYAGIRSIGEINDIEKASALLSQIFGVVGLAWMLIYSVLVGDSSRIKLIGSGLILALAFAANSVWTYALSIFIVATLVTELQFLEKLAAMFTNRDRFWDHLAQKSTQEQTEQKATMEAIQEETAEKADRKQAAQTFSEMEASASSVPPSENNDSDSSLRKPQNNASSSVSEDKAKYNSDSRNSAREKEDISIALRAKNIKAFSEMALRSLLHSTRKLAGRELLSEMRYVTADTIFEVDAVLKTDYVDYIVEIKATKYQDVLKNALYQLDRKIGFYKNIIVASGDRKKVRGILIVAKHAWRKGYFNRPDLIVFELDTATGHLTCVEGDFYFS